LDRLLRGFVNITRRDFRTMVSLLVAGNLHALPLEHGAGMTKREPCCIFVGWCPRSVAFKRRSAYS
jgi:hypothetical protein